MSADAVKSSPNSFATSEATRLDFWRELCPVLSIEAGLDAPRARLTDFERIAELLRAEGYINQPDVIEPELVERLRTGATQLHARKIPPAFLFVYDEPWQVFRSLTPFLAHTLGEDYRMLPGLWAWFVPPSNEAAGWKPHRDRSAITLGSGNRPNSLTVWLPLTDATPLNGCMYVLPAHLDPDLHTPAVSEKNEFNFSSESLQNIRALPATAGSLLAWNQSLLHWGSRASRLGANPRVSMALQFQRGDLPPLERPLLDPHLVPPFAARLGLIGHLISVFSGFLTLPAEIRLLGTALARKYWHRGQ